MCDKKIYILVIINQSGHKYPSQAVIKIPAYVAAGSAQSWVPGLLAKTA